MSTDDSRKSLLPILSDAGPAGDAELTPAEDPAPGEPITVLMIESVGKCNATCSYCPRGADLLAPDTDDFITLEILDKALDLAGSGRNHAVYLHHRGEPFLHPELPEIVRRVRQRGFYAFLSTNLISATPAKVERVLAAGINQIEMHYTAGLTRLPNDVLLKRIHDIRRLNWELRNFGCRLEMNFALTDKDRTAVMEELSREPYYDETFYVRWFEPHDWPSVQQVVDRGVDYRSCQWYRHRACAVLKERECGVEFFLVGQQCAADHVGVSADVLGRRMQHDIGAECERLLQRR